MYISIYPASSARERLVVVGMHGGKRYRAVVLSDFRQEVFVFDMLGQPRIGGDVRQVNLSSLAAYEV